MFDFFEKIKKFEWLSLREFEAVEFINGLMNKSAICCLDPTLLLNKSEWENLINRIKIPVETDYILLYYLENNENLIKIARWYSERLNIPIVCCNGKKETANEFNYINEIGPLEFAKLISNAKSVITSSFHATVFSVLFEKDLRIVLHPITGERVRTLAEICGFESRIYSDFNDFECKFQSMDQISCKNVLFDEVFYQSQQFLNDVIEYTEHRNKSNL